jgi:hypothetical protein
MAMADSNKKDKSGSPEAQKKAKIGALKAKLNERQSRQIMLDKTGRTDPKTKSRMTTIAAQIGRTRAAVDKLKEEPFKASRPETKDTPTNETRSGGRTYGEYQKDKANSEAQDTVRRVKGEKREYDVDMAARKERRKEMMKGASGLRRGSTLRDQGLSDNKPSSSVASKQENYYKNKK